MDINSAFPSSTLKAADMENGDMTLTITDVKVETVGQGQDSEEKPCVYFEETEQKLVLNRTNGNTIAGLYGRETDDWVGKRITLFATEVPFGSKMTMAIRVRMKAPPSKGTAAQRPPQQQQRPAQGAQRQPPRQTQAPVGDDEFQEADIPF